MTHWNGISETRQRAIWRCFDQRVRYDEAHARTVNEEFLRLIKIRISHLIYRANKMKEKPKWMPLLCFNKLQDRKNDAKWLDKSNKAKTNRRYGGKDGKAGPTHTLGQQSALAVLEEMIPAS